MKVMWMAGILAAAGSLAVPVASEAGARIGFAIAVGHDDGYGYGHGRGNRYPDTFRIGYDRGFREGANHGAKDGKHHDNYNFRHDERYRHGDAGYRRGFGPRHEYVAGFRRGYEAAYRRTYRTTRHGYGRDRYGYDDREGRYGTYDNRDWDRNRDRDDDERAYEEPRRRW